MILFICLIFLIIGIVVFSIGFEDMAGEPMMLAGAIMTLIGFCFGVFGLFHGFINYPASEGIHQGTITAVDREGYIFNHYKIYLKSNGKNPDDTSVSDETEYCLYLNESELANIAKEYIGKTVKIYYSHPGGYIGIQSCGTYHINKVELIEE